MQAKHQITNPNPNLNQVETIFFFNSEDLETLEQQGKSPIGSSEGYHVPVIHNLWQACQTTTASTLSFSNHAENIRYAIELIEHIGKGILGDHHLRTTLLRERVQDPEAIQFLSQALQKGLFNYLRGEKQEPDAIDLFAFLKAILGEKDVFIRTFGAIGQELEYKLQLISLLLGFNNFIFASEAQDGSFRSAQLYLSNHASTPDSEEMSSVTGTVDKLFRVLEGAKIHHAAYWETPQQFCDKLEKAFLAAKAAYDALIAKHSDMIAPLKNYGETLNRIEEKLKLFKKSIILGDEVKAVFEQLKLYRDSEVKKDLDRRTTLIHNDLTPTLISGFKQPQFDQVPTIAISDLISDEAKAKIALSPFVRRLFSSVIFQGDWRQQLTGRFKIMGIEELADPSGRFTPAVAQVYTSGQSDPQIHFVRNEDGRIEWVIGHTPLTNLKDPHATAYLGVYVACHIPPEFDELDPDCPPGAYPKIPIYYGMYAQPEYAQPFKELAHSLMPERYALSTPSPREKTYPKKTSAPSAPIRSSSIFSRFPGTILFMSGLGGVFTTSIFLVLFYFIPSLMLSLALPPLGMALAMMGAGLLVAGTGALLFGMVTALVLHLKTSWNNANDIKPKKEITCDLPTWLSAICLELYRPGAYYSDRPKVLPPPPQSLSELSASGIDLSDSLDSSSSLGSAGSTPKSAASDNDTAHTPPGIRYTVVNQGADIANSDNNKNKDAKVHVVGMDAKTAAS